MTMTTLVAYLRHRPLGPASGWALRPAGAGLNRHRATCPTCDRVVPTTHRTGHALVIGDHR